MDKGSLENINKFIYFVDKISYIPALSVSIIFFVFYLEILVNPFDWLNLSSTYLLGAIIGFSIYSYDKNRISTKIHNEEYDHIILDAFCWGIIGCLFHGTGILILIKSLAIIYYKHGEITLSNKDVIKRRDLNIEINLYNSINTLASLAGFVIILLVFYNLGIISFITIITQVATGNLQTLFDPFFIFLITATMILLFDYGSDEFFKINSNYNSKAGTKDLIKGVIGCCFYGAGIFILFRGIIIVFLPENKKPLKKSESAKKVKDVVIYSKPSK